MTTIHVWQIMPTTSLPIHLPDQSSLDAVTRQLPEGYYSTFRTFDRCTRVLGLTSHLRRLFGPVSAPDVEAASLRRQLHALLAPFRPDEARVRAIMTLQGQVFLAIEPLKPLPRKIYEQGVRVETTELRRELPRLKSTTFIARSKTEREHIAEEGIFEALLVKDGKILEGMTSNFFYVLREKNVATACNDILLGVTRRIVIELARGRGLEVRYQPLKRSQLAAVEEAFITSSSRGVVPVVQIDDVRIGQGRPGSITRELVSAYEAYVLEKGERI